MVRQAQRLAARCAAGADRAQGELGPSLTGALEALDFARWDDLPDAELPWERVAELAQAQGIGEADVVWDLAARHGARRTSARPPERRRGVAPRS